ncbi:MAG: aspartate aminotransferase family protein [Clostridiales bacterium]|jgi:acetylornithine/N-succinyldiaminopimelate aminotransferase|nr:aspartate aminotransferase family protein [Clostridiales bacterium]
MDTKQKDRQYLLQNYRRMDAALTEGQGARLKGEDGKPYLDFGSGIAVNTFGANYAPWTEAVTAQLKKLAHTSNIYYNRPSCDLAEALCERTGLKRVFFSNSGAEANEGAIKCARKYSFDKYGENRYEIVTLKNSFHGRTMGTISATGQESFHQYFMPFLPGFAYAPPDDFDAAAACVTDKTCAVMLELIQGEGGVNVLEEGYVKRLAALCAEKDVLLILDEVQTGNGRTGSLYAYQQYGIAPDIVTTAKGLAGGLPLGVTLFGERTANVLTPGSHGSTFGGNPVAAAGALAILSALDERLFKSVRDKGEYLKAALNKMRGVEAVSGRGLMVGAKVKDAAGVMAAALERGLLVLTAKDRLRIMPPLNITYDELDEGIEILSGILDGEPA